MYIDSFYQNMHTKPSLFRLLFNQNWYVRCEAKSSKEIKGIEARLQRTVWNTYMILLYYYESWFIDPKGMMEATPRGINTKTAFSSLKFYSKMNFLHVQ